MRDQRPKRAERRICPPNLKDWLTATQFGGGFQKQESKNVNHEAHKAHEEESGNGANHAIKLPIS
jgi:hypothetical protein